MLRNYLKIALRNLRRHFGYATISVTGLAVGLAACLLIGVFVHHEFNYDRFHERSDQIYRLLMATEMGGSAMIPALGAERLAAYPEVDRSVRLHPSDEIVLPDDRPPVEENDFYYTDQSFFQIFSFDLLHGNSNTVLSEPNSVVLTRATATRYFGTDNPIGQTLALREGPTLRVTGVTENPSSNSHLKFDFLASFNTLGEPQRMDHQSFAYFLLSSTEAAASLKEKLTDLTSSENEAIVEKLGFAIDEMAFELQPLTNIHLYDGLDGAVQAQSDIRYLYIFGALGVFILLLACINFMNLATARSARRAREVGVRKVLGANRGQLAGQFLGESILIAALAGVLALGLAALLLPAFNLFTGQQLSLALLRDWRVVAGFIETIVLTGLLSGSYPAAVLSRFVPSRSLRGRFTDPTGGRRLRQGLVILQFAIAAALLVGTLVVNRQMSFIQQKQLGYDTEQILTLPMTESYLERLQRGKYQPDMSRVRTFKRQLGQVPGVENVAVAHGTPNQYMTSQVKFQDESYQIKSIAADASYLETMGMKLVTGRSFEDARGTDSTRAIIVNESAAKLFNLENNIGEALELSIGVQNPVLIGIVEDFHAASLHHPIGPTVLQQRGMYFDSYVVRLAPNKLPDVLDRLRSTWRQLAPDYPFEYQFLDSQLESLYTAEQRAGRIYSAFAGIAIFIACLGLFGLAAFMAEQRTREIGIRKVLGATATNIVGLMAMDFLKLVAFGITVAVPIAYFAMHRWLQDFAYRIELGPTVFLLAGGIALAVAFLTVSYQSIKAALTNPADSLRYE